MIEIKPDEISAILRQQLSNFNSSADLEEVGSVLQVGDGIARIYGLNNVQSGELVEFENGVRAIALNLEEDNVGVVLMGEGLDIKEGSKVKRTGKIASIKAGMGLVGRVINTLVRQLTERVPLQVTCMKCHLSERLQALFSVNRLKNHFKQVSKQLMQ
jgi:F-type H+-transporting ATPase subunit alpha